jgi:hypothetical protein
MAPLVSGNDVSRAVVLACPVDNDKGDVKGGIVGVQGPTLGEHT